MLRRLAFTLVFLVVLAVVAAAVVESGWGKDKLRQIAVSQANKYLAATLSIGRLEGSLVRGVTLGDVRVVQDGKTIISIDEVSAGYSVRELVTEGLAFHSLRVTKPHVTLARLADGRWNVAALLKPRNTAPSSSGPSFRVPSIEVLNAEVTWPADGRNLAIDHLSGGVSGDPKNWQFDALSIHTPRTALVLSGRISRGQHPVVLDLRVNAERSAFEEWAGVVRGLRNIDVQPAFTLSLVGPVTKLAADVNLKSSAGDIQASLVLDTSVPGWHATGRATGSHFDLSHWLSRPERVSDITGNATLDLDLELGGHFPTGPFTFEGPHAAYIGYEADNLKVKGTLSPTDALIAEATGTAYGSAFHLTSGSSVGIDSPNAFHFVGSDTGMDLRTLPPQVPITHVESVIALDGFDITGQFDAPSFMKGGATFGESVYLGSTIAAGSVGTIDTSVTPAAYTGEGDITTVDIGHFGEALGTAWMLDPRWAGVVNMHVQVAGAGLEGETMTMDASGRLARADLFGGQLHDADFTLHIANGSLNGTYDGGLTSVDAEKAFADPRFAATLTGHAISTFAVRDLMVRVTEMADYDADIAMDLQKSTLRGVAIDKGQITGKLTGATLNVSAMSATGPGLDAQGSGLLEFDGEKSSNFKYVVANADLALARDYMGPGIAGYVTTTGTMTGPFTAMHVAGDAILTGIDVDGTTAASTSAQYDATFSPEAPASATGRVTASVTEVSAFGRRFPTVDGTVVLDNGRIDMDVTLEGLPKIVASGSGTLHPGERAFDLSRLAFTIGEYPQLRLANAAPATISWSDAGFDTMPLEFVDASTGNQHATISGAWRKDGTGTLRLAGNHLSLDALTSDPGGPGRYGGTLDVDATLRGTLEKPIATARIDLTDGRVRKLAYQRLGGTVTYQDQNLAIDVRLDQAAGVWLTAKGTVPASFFQKDLPDAPVDLAIASSTVGLGLLEGITDVVKGVTGQITLDVNVKGTSREPRFTGTVAIDKAGFQIAKTGATYKNGRASFELATDQITVASFHLEDRGGRPLDAKGSLGARALTLGDIKIDVTADHFEVLHNASGTVDVNTNLTLRGTPDAPIVAGDLTILNGELKADQLFEQAAYQPYAMPAPEAPVAPDAIAALNPWDRLTLDVSIHSRGTLRMTGDAVQVAQGTPLGLGAFNLRATGDLYVSKAPNQPAYVTGSFDSISGNLAFQGRRFDVDPTSSINFRGDFNPEVYVTVSREITGVDARVTISGLLNHPELRLSSSPPLESSDILSLIVFNQSTGGLTAGQQQELAVRAGTLAYGFVATPLVAALQRTLGLDTLEIAPPSANNGAVVTVGNELLPGLVAQFTRAFGQEAYDEATLEYYLSRILRLRATFSDAQSLIGRSAFHRVERAGIDLLFFFSF